MSKTKKAGTARSKSVSASVTYWIATKFWRMLEQWGLRRLLLLFLLNYKSLSCCVCAICLCLW